MKLFANAADKLLSAIVPRATAAAWTCNSGCHRVTCFCYQHHYYDKCANNVFGKPDCKSCSYTVYTC